MEKQGKDGQTPALLHGPALIWRVTYCRFPCRVGHQTWRLELVMETFKNTCLCMKVKPCILFINDTVHCLIPVAALYIASQCRTSTSCHVAIAAYSYGNVCKMRQLPNLHHHGQHHSVLFKPDSYFTAYISDTWKTKIWSYTKENHLKHKNAIIQTLLRWYILNITKA